MTVLATAGHVDHGKSTFVSFLTNQETDRLAEEKKRGLAAKARLIEILNEVDDEFVLVSYGVGKFGRCLGDIRIPDIVPNSFKSVNSQLIMEGHGKEYFGGKR